MLLLAAALVVAGAWLVRSFDHSAPAVSAPAPHPVSTSPSPPFESPLASPSASTPTAATTISEILTAPSAGHAATALRLAPLVLDPSRPTDERDEALSHIVNLSTGNEAAVLLPLIRDKRLTVDHCRVILDDALNHSLDWQADVYLAALQSRREPGLRAHVREHLSFLTDGPDLGNDAAVWVEPLIQASLKRTAAPRPSSASEAP